MSSGGVLACCCDEDPLVQCDLFVACARPMDNEGVSIIVVIAIAMTTNYVIFVLFVVLFLYTLNYLSTPGYDSGRLLGIKLKWFLAIVQQNKSE